MCKDEREFQVWTSTLQALVDGSIDANTLEMLKGDEVVYSSTQVKKSKHAVKEAFKGVSDLYSWGWGEWGQTGHQIQDYDQANVRQPRLIESLLGKAAVQVAMGWSHSAALLESGSVLMMGNKLGTGLAGDTYTPLLYNISEKVGVFSVACGHHHTMASTSSGQVYSWGCNQHGQLGHGDTVDSKEPKLIEQLTATEEGLELFITEVYCGAYSTVALADDGKLYTWGCGDHGVLGHNDTKDQVCFYAIAANTRTLRGNACKSA